MSVDQLLHDVVHGDITGAEKRLADWWNGQPQWLKDFVNKVKTDGGTVLATLAEKEAANVAKNGFTAAAFLQALKDVGEQLGPLAINFTQQEIMAAINLAVTTIGGTPVPKPAGGQ